MNEKKEKEKSYEIIEIEKSSFSKTIKIKNNIHNPKYRGSKEIIILESKGPDIELTPKNLRMSVSMGNVTYETQIITGNVEWINPVNNIIALGIDAEQYSANREPTKLTIRKYSEDPKRWDKINSIKKDLYTIDDKIIPYYSYDDNGDKELNSILSYMYYTDDLNSEHNENGFHFDVYLSDDKFDLLVSYLDRDLINNMSLYFHSNMIKYEENDFPDYRMTDSYMLFRNTKDLNYGAIYGRTSIEFTVIAKKKNYDELDRDYEIEEENYRTSKNPIVKVIETENKKNPIQLWILLILILIFIALVFNK